MFVIDAEMWLALGSEACFGTCVQLLLAGASHARRSFCSSSAAGVLNNRVNRIRNVIHRRRERNITDLNVCRGRMGGTWTNALLCGADLSSGVNCSKRCTEYRTEHCVADVECGLTKLSGFSPPWDHSASRSSG